MSKETLVHALDSLVAPGDRQTRIASDDSPMVQNVTECDTSADASAPPTDAETLTPIQLMAIAHLLSGKTVTECATSLNISRNTLHRWKSDPTFKQTLNQRADDAVRTAASRMRRMLLASTAQLMKRIKKQSEFHLPFKIATNKRVWDACRVMPVEVEKNPSTKGR